MEINVLKEFIDLASTCSFSETANKLYISQPALSKHIFSLEAQLGAQLFIRTNHRIYLTEIGVLFLQCAKSIVKTYDEGLLQIQRIIAGYEGSLNIGFLNWAVRNRLIPCIQRFHLRYPNTALNIVSYELGDLNRAFIGDEIDISLTALFKNSVLRKDWRFEELYTDGMATVIPSNHPLAKRVCVHFDELLDYPLILPSKHHFPVLSELLHGLIEKSGQTYKINAEYKSLDDASLMAEAEGSITIVPKHYGLHLQNASLVNIVDPETIVRIGALWKTTNNNPLIKHFIEELLMSP